MKKIILLLQILLLSFSVAESQQFGIYSTQLDNDKITAKVIADGTIKGALGQSTSDGDVPLAGSLGLILSDRTFRFTGLYKVGATIDTVFGAVPKDYLSALLAPEAVGNSSVKIDLQLLNIFSTANSENNSINWLAFHSSFYITSAHISSPDKMRSEEATIVKGLLTWNPQLRLFEEHKNDGNRIYVDGEIGFGYYGVAGDFLQSANTKFRSDLFGGDSYQFLSLHMGFSTRVNNLRLAFEFPYIQALNGASAELHGITGWRFIASASVDASLDLISF